MSTTESVLSIDSFRALDTTRLFCAKTRRPDTFEKKLVASFPAGYLLNRIFGGVMSPGRSLFIEAEVKRRGLVTDVKD